jgi:hypothetical protein
MLDSPFTFEDELTADDYQRIGRLALKWSHIDHIIGNCLKVMLGQTDEQAVVTVFSLGARQRLNQIKELAALKPLNPDAQIAFDELRAVMAGLQFVRNGVVHAIIVSDDREGHVFHLRSKKRNLTKSEVFATEEITNYAAHAVLSLRYALGLKGADPAARHPLPERPEIPEFLRELIPIRKK